MAHSSKKRKRGAEAEHSNRQTVGTTPESGEEFVRGCTRSATKTTTRTAGDETTTTKVKRPYITDKSLSHNGSLSCRLDRSQTHYPVPTINRRVKCGLHRWCSGLQKRGQVMDCETCGVALCLPCYKLFHETVDLVQMKDSLKKEFKADWDGSEPTTT